MLPLSCTEWEHTVCGNVVFRVYFANIQSFAWGPKKFSVRSIREAGLWDLINVKKHLSFSSTSQLCTCLFWFMEKLLKNTLKILVVKRPKFGKAHMLFRLVDNLNYFLSVKFHN